MYFSEGMELFAMAAKKGALIRFDQHLNYIEDSTAIDYERNFMNELDPLSVLSMIYYY